MGVAGRWGAIGLFGHTVWRCRWERSGCKGLAALCRCAPGGSFSSRSELRRRPGRSRSELFGVPCSALRVGNGLESVAVGFAAWQRARPLTVALNSSGGSSTMHRAAFSCQGGCCITLWLLRDVLGVCAQPLHAHNRGVLKVWGWRATSFLSGPDF